MKYCIKCKIEYPEDYFYKTSKGFLRSDCKKCTKFYSKQWKKENPESNKTHKRNYRLKYRERELRRVRQWQIKNNYSIKYSKSQHYVDWRRKHEKLRRKYDLTYRLKSNLRIRLICALKNNHKKGSAVRDLGCSIEKFKKYIESKFEKGMTWSNYGKWHLDHIKPLASFNLQNKVELLKAVHYTNYQPLWAIDNIKKGCKT